MRRTCSGWLRDDSLFLKRFDLFAATATPKDCMDSPNALLYVSRMDSTTVSGMPLCLSVDVMSSRGTDPKAFVQSIASVRRFVFLLLGSLKSSSTTMLCSVHPLHLAMKLFVGVGKYLF